MERIHDLITLLETGQITIDEFENDPDVLYQEHIEMQLTEETALTGGLLEQNIERDDNA